MGLLFLLTRLGTEKLFFWLILFQVVQALLLNLWNFSPHRENFFGFIRVNRADVVHA